ncbi:tetratricopeptide repeat protein [Kutzneria sp. 744]|nr:tetratricopeptide repeat protein [Kutzneria sp. 744]
MMALSTVTGVRPDIPWSAAPWFGDDRFLDTVSADALAEAAMRTMDYGRDLDPELLGPWFHAIEAVAARNPLPEPMAKMAIMLRACGRTDVSLELCDQTDAVQRIMFTEVVQAGTWRALGDPVRTAAAFERALALEPDNWSLYLDLADLHAEQGDFAAAAESVERGLRHAPEEPTLRAAGAAYRARRTGSAADLRELIDLAPQVPNASYRRALIDYACAGPGLPDDLVEAARRL